MKMGKAETNKKRKKNALFQTAYELFTDKGFAKTTISDIVNKAGLAKRNILFIFQGQVRSAGQADCISGRKAV